MVVTLLIVQSARVVQQRQCVKKWRVASGRRRITQSPVASAYCVIHQPILRTNSCRVHSAFSQPARHHSEMTNNFLSTHVYRYLLASFRSILQCCSKAARFAFEFKKNEKQTQKHARIFITAGLTAISGDVAALQPAQKMAVSWTFEFRGSTSWIWRQRLAYEKQQQENN
jgi:hypothetical protein